MFKRLSWRPIAAGAILVLTVGLFIAYFVNNPEVWQNLKDIPKGVLLTVLGLYLLFTGSLAFVNNATLKLCRKTMSVSESLLLTMYSAVINFFGPLQSGPAFRAVYVKQQHGVKIKDYTLASFVYYFFYGLFSGMLLFSGVLGWWLFPATLISLVGVVVFRERFAKFKTLALKYWYYMALATFVQVALLATIFTVELRAVDPAITFSQILIYTGAANLALFVSFTPGAIGFREAFLVFSQNLHHISNSTIVAANTIDRTIYVLLLLILGVFIMLTHTGKKLKAVVSLGQNGSDSQHKVQD